MAQFAAQRSAPSNRLLDRLCQWCRPALAQGVANTRADRYVKRHHSADMALALVSYFLYGMNSLRQLERRLAADEGLQRATGLAPISTAHLPKLLHERPSDLWLPLLQSLMAQLPVAKLPAELRVVDSTFFRMGARLWGRQARQTVPREAAGVKLGLMLEPDRMCPTATAVQVGMGSDATVWPQLLAGEAVQPGRIYLFDRGLRDYAVFNQIMAAGADFVTRAYQRQLHAEVVEHLPLAADAPHVLADRLVLVGKRQRRLQRPVRHITVVTAERGEVGFVTSILDRPAAELAELYRRRWQIEVFFRWLKSTIGLIRPLAYSVQAAEHTVYAALVAYLLLLLLTQEQLIWPESGKMRGLKAALESVRLALEEHYKRRLGQSIRRVGFL